MFRLIYYLLFDIFFIYALVAFGNEMGGYIILFLAAVAYFTWEVIRTIIHWLK